MILTLLQREFAVRSLLWWTPLAAFLGFYIWLMDAREYQDPHGPYYASTVVWIVLATFMFTSRCTTRASSQLDLALPLSSRRLWAVHMLAIVFAGLLILVVIAGAFASGNLLSGRRPLLEAHIIDLIAHMAVGLIFAVAAIQSPRTSLFEIPLRAAYLWLIIAIMSGYLGLVFLLVGRPRLWLLVPLGVALALGLRVYGSLPRTFRLVAFRPEPLARSAVSDSRDRSVGVREVRRAAGRPRYNWLLYSTIFRAEGGYWHLFFPVALAYHGFVVAFGSWEKLRIPYVFFTVCVLFGYLMVSLRKLPYLDPLAVSRRRIFAALMLPASMAVVFGYVLGSAADRLFAAPVSRVDLRASDCCLQIGVPGAYWEITLENEPPTSGSPWGESVVPNGQALFEGSRTQVYQPFCLTQRSSEDFVALQLSRAIETLYGVAIPYEELRGRYLQTGSDGRVLLKESDFRLLEDYPELRRRGAPSTLPLFLLSVGLPWLLVSAGVFRSHRVGTGARLAGWVAIGTFVLVLLLGIAFVILSAAGVLDTMTWSRFTDILVRYAFERLPGGALTVAGLSLLLLFCGYWLAQAQFMRVEATTCQRTDSFRRST